MSRDMTSAMSDVMEADVVRPIIFIKAEFDSGDVLMWSGLGDLDWAGETWLGGGSLLGVEAIEESAEVKATGTRVSLSGIPSELLSIALQEDYSGRPLSIWFGATDESGNIIADPVLLFKGRMDVMSIQEGSEFSKIDVTVESRLIEFERARERRYTSEDQKIDYPNDKGLEFVSSIQDKQIVWGRIGG